MAFKCIVFISLYLLKFKLIAISSDIIVIKITAKFHFNFYQDSKALKTLNKSLQIRYRRVFFSVRLYRLCKHYVVVIS